MLLSKLVGERVKEAPSDVTILSHVLLARAGYIKPVANGRYSLTSPAQLMALNIENIIRDEMNKIDGQDFRLNVYGIVNSLTELGDIQRVRITVDGKLIEEEPDGVVLMNEMTAKPDLVVQ